MSSNYIVKYENKGFVTKITANDYQEMKYILESIGLKWNEVKTENGDLMYKTKMPYETVLYINKNTTINFEFENWIQKALKKYTVPIKFVRKPYPHQVKALEHLLRFGSAPLLLDMGTGKTKIVLDLFKMRRELKQVSKLFVVCPISCIQVWVDEAKQENLTTCNLRGMKQDQILDVLRADYDVYILNYDMLKRLFRVIKRPNKQKEEYLFLMPKYFNKYFMLAFDESTKIKSHATKRTILSMKIAEHVKYKNILTGTLIGNTLEDVWSQISIVSTVFKNNYSKLKSHWQWLMYFFYTNEYTHKSTVKSILKEDFINWVSTAKAFTFTAKDLKLPPKMYSKRYIELSKEQKEYYEKVKNELYTEFDEGVLTVSNMAVKLGKLSEITSGFVYLHDEEGHKTAHVFKNNTKLNELVEILSELDKNKKYIIWHLFKAEGEIIKRRLEKEGYKNIVVLKKGADFDQNEFNSFKGSRILLANTAMIGYGNTIKGVEHVIYYSNSWSYLDRQQSESRTQRIGINTSCNYIDLIARMDSKPIIDDYILSVIQRKKKLDDVIKKYGIKRLLDTL